MCKAVSGITKSDGTIFMPDSSAWNHSHTDIAKLHGLPDGLFGDKYARWELTPKDGDYRSDQSSWVFRLDEQRAPGWWAEDALAFEDQARKATAQYMRAVPDCLVPGFRATGGYGSTLTGGDGSTLTGGYGSTLTGGDWSTLTGGGRSTLTGGYGSTLTGGDGSTLTGGEWSTLTGGGRSTLTGGYGSTLTGGDGSTLCWRVWDGVRFRLHVRYTGEDGIEAKVKYRYANGKIEKVDG